MEFEWTIIKIKLTSKNTAYVLKTVTYFYNKTISFKDDRKDYGEERFITLGELEKQVVVIVHTQREFITRIISMRKANEREKEIYIKRLKEIGEND